MTKPLIQIDDLVREMTDEEFAQYEAQRIESERLQAEQEAKAQTRASALAKLAEATGLTEEEIAAL
jgi:pyrroloquinoline quinone (PQQ) biosynthesis protein C